MSEEYQNTEITEEQTFTEPAAEVPASAEPAAQPVDLNPEDVAKFASAMKQLWTIVIFCVVGFLIMLLGLEFDKTLFAIGGALLIALPTVIAFRKHGIKGIGMLDYEFVDEYQDSSGNVTRRETNMEMSIFALAIGLILTILLGVLATPIRYIIYCFKYSVACKKLNYKPAFKDGMLFPTAVGLGGFFAVLIIMSIVQKIHG